MDWRPIRCSRSASELESASGALLFATEIRSWPSPRFKWVYVRLREFLNSRFGGEEALAYAGNNNSSHGTSVRGASFLHCTHFLEKDWGREGVEFDHVWCRVSYHGACFFVVEISELTKKESYEGLGEHCWWNSIPVLVSLAESNFDDAWWSLWVCSLEIWRHIDMCECFSASWLEWFCGCRVMGIRIFVSLVLLNDLVLKS